MFFELPPTPPSAIEEVCTAEYRDFMRTYSDLPKTEVDGKGEAFSERRNKELSREAKIVGVLRGKEYRRRELKEILESPEVVQLLDSHHFGPLMVTQNVTAPVIEETNRSLSITDSRAAKSARKTWRVIEGSKIIAGRLTWHTYFHGLSSGQKVKRRVYSYFKPRNRKENEIWEQGFCNGYAQGIDVANDEFVISLNRFVRDYTGMVRYKKLEKLNIISPADVRELRIGTVVQDDRVDIDVRETMIKTEAKFTKENEWNNLILLD